MNNSDVLDIASLVVTWSGIFMTAFTLIFSLLAIFGFREVSKIRKYTTEFQKLNESMSILKGDIQQKMHSQEQTLTNVKKKFKNLEHKLINEIKTKIESNHLLTLAKESFHRGDYFRAIDFYDSSLKINPTDYSILFEIGRCYLYLGQHEAAIEQFLKCKELNPSGPHSFIGLSHAYRFINLNEAVKFNIQAIELSKNNHNYYEHLGLLQRMQGQYDEAVISFKKAFEIEESHDCAMFLSTTYKLIDDVENHNLYLEKVKELAQNDINVGYRLIWSYMSMWYWYTCSKKYTEAIESIKMLDHFWVTDYRVKLLRNNFELVFKSLDTPLEKQNLLFEALESVKGRAKNDLIIKNHISHEWGVEKK